MESAVEEGYITLDFVFSYRNTSLAAIPFGFVQMHAHTIEKVSFLFNIFSLSLPHSAEYELVVLNFTT